MCNRASQLYISLHIIAILYELDARPLGLAYLIYAITPCLAACMRIIKRTDAVKFYSLVKQKPRALLLTC